MHDSFHIADFAQRVSAEQRFRVRLGAGICASIRRRANIDAEPTLLLSPIRRVAGRDALATIIVYPAEFASVSFWRSKDKPTDQITLALAPQILGRWVGEYLYHTAGPAVDRRGRGAGARLFVHARRSDEPFLPCR